MPTRGVKNQRKSPPTLPKTPLMLEVRQQFQVSFSLREFFEASSLRAFAQLIDERRTSTVHANGYCMTSPFLHPAI